VRDHLGLIGGVYGVSLGAAFFGESMFSRRTDASKIALAWLVAHLNRSGYRLFDVQFLTPHLATLGGIEISRGEYRSRLSEALAQPAEFTHHALPENGQEVVHLNTQTSYRK
jgi:leucyl/phenylalanyl-tRNA--protein transferase